MKTNANKISVLSKYDAVGFMIILLAIVLIVMICLWCDHQNSRIESELVKFQ